MRKILSAAASFAIAAGLVWVFSGNGCPVAAAGQEPDTSTFSWADSCKDCHKTIYDAWARTKHARALDRLSDVDRQKTCVRCHITGAQQVVQKRLSVVNAGVQCEACHGGGAAHAADPTVRAGLVKTPGDARCRECHNDRSPHFKGFVYSAMKGYVHRAK